VHQGNVIASETRNLSEIASVKLVTTSSDCHALCARNDNKNNLLLESYDLELIIGDWSWVVLDKKGASFFMGDVVI